MDCTCGERPEEYGHCPAFQLGEHGAPDDAGPCCRAAGLGHEPDCFAAGS